MNRRKSDPRPDWQARVESQGLHFHTLDGVPYWDESACYEFTTSEIDDLEKASYTLNDLCLKALEHVFSNELFDRFDIAPQYVPWLKQSWERDQQTLYGRFDFAFDGRTPPKLLEYNADTPTALLEAAVIQWHWMQDVRAGSDQFNSIHERLIEFWRGLNPQPEGAVHFLSVRGHLEDFMTANYLRDVAEQAGLKSVYMPIEDVGWNSARKAFVDLDENVIRTCFKLYPWDWLMAEEFGPHLLETRTRWFEPPWKLLLADKRMLIVLWELFPECPYLLRTADKPWNQNYVCKPALGREGANVTMVANGNTVAETPGDYAEGPFVYQDLRPLRAFDGNYPVLGSWMVNGYACGMGIREDNGPVTKNTSRFVPHVFGG
ncbi:MAG: glutathionylspermidine synthase family protein [Gemmataceae bacterium]|nr:glutathionylspermidine synthase family protein [Gemmataceae bacterium]